MPSVIEIRITASNAQAIAALKQVANEAERSGSKVKNAGSGGFSGLISSGDGFISTLGRIGLAAQGLTVIFKTVYETAKTAFGPGIDFDRQIETAQLGISGIIMSMTKLNGHEVGLGDAMKIANDAVSQLQEKSAKIGLPLKDMVSAFQSIVGPGLQAKMSMDQIVQFTVTGTKAVKSMMSPMANEMQIVQELRSMVSGNIDQNSQVARALGITNEQVNQAKQSAGGLFQYLQERLNGFSAIAEVYPTTLNGIIEKFASMFQQASGNSVKPFISDFKEGLSAITKSLFTVNEATKEINFNPAITSVIKSIEDGVNNLRDYITRIGPTITDVKTAVINVYEAIKPLLLSIADLFDKCAPPVVKLIDTIARLINDSAPALQAIMKALAYVISLVADNIETLISKLAAVALAFATVEAAVIAVKGALWALGKITVFAEMIEMAYGAAKAIKSIEGAVTLLGVAFQKLSTKNIVLTLLSVAGVIWGDKLIAWAEQMAGADSAISKPAKSMADLQREQDTNTLPPINTTQGNGILEPKQLPSTYDKDSKQVDIALEAEKGRLAQVVKNLNEQISEINAKTQAGLQLTLEDQAKIAAINLQIEQEKLNSNQVEQNIVSGLYSSDTDGSHKDDINKKLSTLKIAADSLQPDIDKAQKAFDQLGEVIGQFGSIAAGTAQGVQSFGEQIINIGKEQLGLEYHMGGDGVSSTDCGKFTLDTFKKMGINLVDRMANDQYDQYNAAGAIKNDLSQAKPGDLLFFYYPGDGQDYSPGETRVGHVGIYAGDNQMLHASSSRHQVSLTGIDTDHLVGIGDTSKLIGKDTAAQGSSASNTYATIAKDWKKQLESGMEGVTEAKAKALKFAADMLDKAAEVESDYQGLIGDTTAKAYLDIDTKYAKLRQQFAAGGAPMKDILDKIDKMEVIEKNRADFSQTQKDIETANTELGFRESEFLNIIASGAENASQVLMEYSAAYLKSMQVSIEKLKDELKKAEDSATGDKETAIKIRAELAKIPAALNAFLEKTISQTNEKIQNQIDAINADPTKTNLVKNYETDLLTKQQHRENADTYNTQANLIESDKKKWNDEHKDMDADLIIRQLRAKARLEELQGQVTTLMQDVEKAGRQGLENGLLNFFEEGYKSCHKLIDAVKDLASSVLSEMNKVFAQDLTRRLMQKFYPKPPGAKDGGSLEKYADGGSMDSGQVKGPGTGTSDSILAYLGNFRKFVRIANGEYVIKEKAVNKFGTKFFDKLNSGLIPDEFLQVKAKFAAGGSTSGKIFAGAKDLAASLPGNGDVSVPLRIINVSDPNAVPKYMQSRDGEKVFLNVVEKNSEVIKRLIRR